MKETLKTDKIKTARRGILDRFDKIRKGFISVLCDVIEFAVVAALKGVSEILHEASL